MTTRSRLFVGLVVASLVPVGQAHAWEEATFRGKTSQGRHASVRVGVAGTIERLVVNWGPRCQNGRLSTGTRITPRFGHRRRFSGRSSYRSRYRGGISIRYRVAIRARRVTRQRFKGTFRGSAVVRRRGRVVDRCRLGRIRWVATVPVARLVFAGEAGDYISGGRRYAYQSPGPGAKVGIDPSRRTIIVSVGPWNLTIDAPGGRKLRKQTYSGALRYPFNEGRPGLDISGDGRGCNQLFGSFTVHALAFDRRGLRVVRVSFEQHCENPAAPALRGQLRYRRG